MFCFPKNAVPIAVNPRNTLGQGNIYFDSQNTREIFKAWVIIEEI